MHTFAGLLVLIITVLVDQSKIQLASNSAFAHGVASKPNENDLPSYMKMPNDARIKFDSITSAFDVETAKPSKMKLMFLTLMNNLVCPNVVARHCQRLNRLEEQMTVMDYLFDTSRSNQLLEWAKSLDAEAATKTLSNHQLTSIS